MQLPKDFETLMRQQYGEEKAEELFKGLSTEPSVSIRLNRKKIEKFGKEGVKENIEKFGKTDIGDFCIGTHPVPWCPDAYYLDERPPFTFDPLFHAGVYYVQEASSMYLAEIIRKHALTDNPSPLCALDLCAAPGGKSTLLRSILPDETLLVCNEPIAKRTNILAENMQKWGHPNTIVSQNFPNEFRAFPHTFDLIITDVPCSGEGMFRKDEGAIHDWSLENVDLCWQRQRDILTSIWPCLKEGGLLVYSTCTFNHFEDEDNARWIASSLGAELLEERHFFPGQDHGEGFYIAALRKNKTTSDGESPNESASKEKDREKLLSSLKRKFAHGLRCLVNGIPAPTQKGKDMIPAHALALSTSYDTENYPTCELTYNEALAYLRHEVLRIEAPRGIVLVTYQNFPLGFVKNIGNRANNLYPQEWRIRTTHTTPFCLIAPTTREEEE